MAPAKDLTDRRVEITGALLPHCHIAALVFFVSNAFSLSCAGPVDAKMIINALNCGAKVFMVSISL